MFSYFHTFTERPWILWSLSSTTIMRSRETHNNILFSIYQFFYFDLNSIFLSFLLLNVCFLFLLCTVVTLMYFRSIYLKYLLYNHIQGIPIYRKNNLIKLFQQQIRTNGLYCSKNNNLTFIMIKYYYPWKLWAVFDRQFNPDVRTKQYYNWFY